MPLRTVITYWLTDSFVPLFIYSFIIHSRYIPNNITFCYRQNHKTFLSDFLFKQTGNYFNQQVSLCKPTKYIHLKCFPSKVWLIRQLFRSPQPTIIILDCNLSRGNCQGWKTNTATHLFWLWPSFKFGDLGAYPALRGLPPAIRYSVK